MTALRRPRFALGVLLMSALCATISSAQERTTSAPMARQESPFSRSMTREQWQMPVRVMDAIGVRPGMTVADVGAGDGWFTFYLAERVGPSGRVIAEDIDARALQALRERCASEKVSNVSVLVGQAKDPMLPAGSADLALMVNVLSALGNAKDLLKNLAKGLKPDGRLVVIDWDPAKVYPEMPKQEAVSALRQTQKQLQDADFEVEARLDFLPVQTIWICTRRARNPGTPQGSCGFDPRPRHSHAQPAKAIGVHRQ